MRRSSVVAFSLALLCAACDKEGVEDDGGADGPAEACGEQSTQNACDGLSGENWHCAWVDVQSSTGTCEEGTTESQCVTLRYQGAGCITAYACGAAQGPNTYVRDMGEAGVQVFALETCEYQPELDWDQCQWTDMDVSPHEACACAC
jgi:hypothetical protein